MTSSDQSDKVSPAGLRWIPHTDAERRSVREELARVLADPLFRNSKRYPSFLEHVVEQTLTGQTESLKERTVGIEVFGRRPDYDTNVDHMVRNVAAEVRKRLAEYYEASPAALLRIEIPAGSYAAQFRILQPEPTVEPAPAPPPPAPEPAPSLESAPRPRRLSTGVAIAITAALLIAILAARFFWVRKTADEFWAPLWASSGPLVLCIAGPEGFSVEPGPDVPRPESLADSQRFRSLVNFSDTLTLLRIAQMAQAHGKDYRVLYSRDSRVSDLYSGSSVLIGTGDDELVRLISSGLRFHFEHDGPVSRIVDERNPKRNDWVVNWLTPYEQLANDYAIVWRVRERYSGRYAAGIAGITRIAVAGTGELLASPEGMVSIEHAIPGAAKDKNVEIVLRIQVDRGSPFPPEVVATYVW